MNSENKPGYQNRNPEYKTEKPEESKLKDYMKMKGGIFVNVWDNGEKGISLVISYNNGKDDVFSRLGTIWKRISRKTGYPYYFLGMQDLRTLTGFMKDLFDNYNSEVVVNTFTPPDKIKDILKTKVSKEFKKEMKKLEYDDVPKSDEEEPF